VAGKNNGLGYRAVPAVSFVVVVCGGSSIGCATAVGTDMPPPVVYART
jgi:hypothetical protein